MLNIILKDIKNMLRRPLILLILVLGLISASMSAILYYSYGSISLNIKGSALNQDKTIEAQGFDIGFYYDDLIKLVESGKLPDVWFITVTSYASENYDVIGYKEYSEYFTASIGEFIEPGDEEKNVCVVSANWFDEKTVELGENIMLNGKDYTVKGINSGYDPVIFDIRRLQEGTEYVAGMDFTLERGEETKDRPNKCAIVPLEDLDAIGHTVGLLHISFVDPISAEQRAELEELLMNELVISSFTPISVFYESHSITQWSDFTIYFVAIAAGIINIISLFAYWIRNNKRQYEIYKLLGASNKRITIIILSELFIYVTIGFLISLCGAIPLINNLSLFKSASIPSASALVIIFLLLCLVAAAMCAKQIRNITLSNRSKQP